MSTLFVQFSHTFVLKGDLIEYNTLVRQYGGEFFMFSKRLKYMRKLRNLSQEELGKKINSTKGTISNYENEYSTPSNEVLKDLADVLDTTTDYLLGRSDDPQLTEKQERMIDKETQEILDLLNQLPEEERKEYLAKFKAYVDIATHAKDKD